MCGCMFCAVMCVDMYCKGEWMDDVIVRDELL